MSSPPTERTPVSVIIVTRNRVDDLRRALRSVLMQDVPCEVLVWDDASTDGTAAIVGSEFPGVRLFARERSTGYIVARNELTRAATGDVVFSIDDDAEFSTPRVVRQTLADFKHPRVAAVSIPHQDILISPEFKTPTPPAAGDWVVGAYVGTAHAVRREVFLQAGGYREVLLHNGEEREFCTRLLNFGYVTLLGTADSILHYASPVREAWRNRMLERRNDLLYALWNVPMPQLLFHLPGTILSGLRFGVTHGVLRQTVTGYLKAVPVMWRTMKMRDPIGGYIYQLLRKMNRDRVMSIEEVIGQLGPAGNWQGRGPGIRAYWSSLETTSAMKPQ